MVCDLSVVTAEDTGRVGVRHVVDLGPPGHDCASHQKESALLKNVSNAERDEESNKRIRDPYS